MEDIKETLWRRFEMHVDLYKFYLDGVIKLNTFHYAITGAILSFYFTRPDVPLAKWSLALPCGMSVGFTFIFCFGLRSLVTSRNDLLSIRDQLGLGTAPEFRVLGVLIGICAVIHSVTAVALFALLLFR